MSKVKTGQELIADFFQELEKKKDMDKDIVRVLIELFAGKKLTRSNIFNKLEEIRKQVKEINENKGN